MSDEKKLSKAERVRELIRLNRDKTTEELVALVNASNIAIPKNLTKKYVEENLKRIAEAK